MRSVPDPTCRRPPAPGRDCPTPPPSAPVAPGDGVRGRSVGPPVLPTPTSAAPRGGSPAPAAAAGVGLSLLWAEHSNGKRLRRYRISFLFTFSLCSSSPHPKRASSSPLRLPPHPIPAAVPKPGPCQGRWGGGDARGEASREEQRKICQDKREKIGNPSPQTTSQGKKLLQQPEAIRWQWWCGVAGLHGFQSPAQSWPTQLSKISLAGRFSRETDTNEGR